MNQNIANHSIFVRVEKKYELTNLQYEKLLEELSPYMKMDDYGLHTILIFILIQIPMTL